MRKLKALTIRFLFWLLHLLGVTVEWVQETKPTGVVQQKAVLPAKKKCTIRKYVGPDGEVFQSHSICDGKLLTPPEVREKKGWPKIHHTSEEMHLV